MVDYKEIADKISSADAILVGASNGLSITEDLHIFADNEAFKKLFGDFREKYGIKSILQGFFFDWRSDEERWAFISRLISHYSLNYSGSPVMTALKKLLSQKPYFIVTSNGENHFELAGFDAEKILEIEGSWKEMRCACGCGDALYPTFDVVRKMAAEEKNGRIPSELVPHCPKCGGSMIINTRPSPNRLNAYQAFIKENHNKRLLISELGIGARNQLIKAPLMNLAYHEPNAFYITFNKGELYIPVELQSKSLGVDGDLGEILPKIAETI